MNSAISVACPGACCASFPMSETYEGLIQSAAGKTGAPGWRVQDDIRLLDLIVPVDTYEPKHPMVSDGILYGCRAFDRETRKCREYEQRPRVCTDYPYGRACVWCTFDPNDPTKVPVLRPWSELFPAHTFESGCFDPVTLDVVLLVPE